MSKIDLNGATSIVLPDGREVKIEDLRTAQDTLKALNDQADRLKGESAQAVQLYKSLQDPDAQKQLAVRLVQNLHQSSPDELRSIVSELGYGVSDEGDDEQDADTGRGAGLDPSAIAQMIQSAVENAVNPLRAELAQRDSRALVDKEIAAIRKDNPGLSDDDLTNILKLAADKAAPGQFRLDDAKRLSDYDRLAKEVEELRGAKARSAASELFPGIIKNPGSKPDAEAEKTHDYRTEAGRQAGAEEALMNALSAAGLG